MIQKMKSFAKIDCAKSKINILLNMNEVNPKEALDGSC
jgi:hypothetical protein